MAEDGQGTTNDKHGDYANGFRLSKEELEIVTPKRKGEGKRPKVLHLEAGESESVQKYNMISKEFEAYLILLNDDDKNKIREGLAETVKYEKQKDKKTKAYKEFTVSSHTYWKMKQQEYDKDLKKIDEALDSLGPRKTTKAGTKTANLIDTLEHGLTESEVSLRRQQILKKFREARYLHEWIRDTCAAHFMRDNAKFEDKEYGVLDKYHIERNINLQSALQQYN